jgi:hypothetical protein
MFYDQKEVIKNIDLIDFPDTPNFEPLIFQAPNVPELSPEMIELMTTFPVTSDPEALDELRQSFPISSTPAALEALANAPTVPQKILALRNFLNGWVNYSIKQKIALERFVYQEALRHNQRALKRSLQSALAPSIIPRRRRGELNDTTFPPPPKRQDKKALPK